MQSVILIVGKSESGKTTLLEGLIAELTRRGYRMAVVKHTAEELELDMPQKDTWRYSRAGSRISAINSGRKVALFWTLEHDFKPEELAGLTGGGYDLLLAEGFKQSHLPRIEVHRSEQGKGLLSPPELLLAVVTDEKLDTPVPQFNKDDVSGVADFIERCVLPRPGKDRVNVSINGEPVPITQDISDLLTQTLLAITSKYEGVDKLHDISVSLRRKL